MDEENESESDFEEEEGHEEEMERIEEQRKLQQAAMEKDKVSAVWITKHLWSKVGLETPFVHPFLECFGQCNFVVILRAFMT